MCEDEKSAREWRSFITHMIESGEAVMSFTEGLDINDFQRDERTYKATLWDLRIIGEAATRIPNEIREANPHIQWRQMIGMRNRITHAYEATDTDIVWDTIKSDIPKMLTYLREMLKRIDEEQI